MNEKGENKETRNKDCSSCCDCKLGTVASRKLVQSTENSVYNVSDFKTLMLDPALWCRMICWFTFVFRLSVWTWNCNTITEILVVIVSCLYWSGSSTTLHPIPPNFAFVRKLQILLCLVFKNMQKLFWYAHIYGCDVTAMDKYMLHLIWRNGHGEWTVDTDMVKFDSFCICSLPLLIRLIAYPFISVF